MKRFSVLLGFLFLCFCFQLKAEEIPRLISVTGRGEVLVQPNEAVITIGVETREVNLQQASRDVDSKASQIIEHLRNNGIDSKNIKTSYASLQPYYSYRQDQLEQTKPDFYIAQKSMTFVLKDLEKYDQIMLGLYDVGVNRIDGVDFRVSDIEKHRIEAKRRAVVNAEELATVLATELNAKVLNVFAISEPTVSSSPIPRFHAKMAMSAMADSVGGSVGSSIAGGEVSISANIDVSFSLGN